MGKTCKQQDRDSTVGVEKSHYNAWRTGAAQVQAEMLQVNCLPLMDEHLLVSLLTDCSILRNKLVMHDTLPVKN